MATGFPRPEITWLKDGIELYHHKFFQVFSLFRKRDSYQNYSEGIPNRNLRKVVKSCVLQVHEWPVGNDTLKSKMEIDPATQKDAGYYECQADNQYAVDRRGFRTDYVMISY